MLRRALRIRKPVLLPILIGGLLALASVSSAVAAPPSSPDLNPPAPDIYTCNPDGSGTICRAHTVDPYENEPTGIFCGSGANVVEIVDSGIRDVRATRWYDTDGNLVRRLRTFLFRDAHLTNPATGQVLPYSQLNNDNDALAVPGDFGSSTLTSSGHMSMTAPGFGRVVLDAGHLVVAPDGEVVARHGPTDFADYFAGTNTLDDLCAFLGTPNS